MSGTSNHYAVCLQSTRGREETLLRTFLPVFIFIWIEQGLCKAPPDLSAMKVFAWHWPTYFCQILASCLFLLNNTQSFLVRAFFFFKKKKQFRKVPFLFGFEQEGVLHKSVCDVNFINVVLILVSKSFPMSVEFITHFDSIGVAICPHLIN